MEPQRDRNIAVRTEECEVDAPIREYRLRLNQTISRADFPGDIIIVHQGIVSVAVLPTASHRRIVDILLPGDAFVASLLLLSNKSWIKAHTEVILSGLPPMLASSALLAHWRAQTERAYVHELILGLPDLAARVASFILGLLLRNPSEEKQRLESPLSREELAEYLAINRDTLSRIMAEFERRGLLKRVNCHALEITDLAALCRLSPITEQLRSAFAQSATRSRPEGGGRSIRSSTKIHNIGETGRTNAATASDE